MKALVFAIVICICSFSLSAQSKWELKFSLGAVAAPTQVTSTGFNSQSGNTTLLSDASGFYRVRNQHLRNFAQNFTGQSVEIGVYRRINAKSKLYLGIQANSILTYSAIQQNYSSGWGSSVSGEGISQPYLKIRYDYEVLKKGRFDINVFGGVLVDINKSFTSNSRDAELTYTTTNNFPEYRTISTEIKKGFYPTINTGLSINYRITKRFKLGAELNYFNTPVSRYVIHKEAYSDDTGYFKYDVSMKPSSWSTNLVFLYTLHR